MTDDIPEQPDDAVSLRQSCIRIGGFKFEFGRWLKINGMRVCTSGPELQIVELLARRKGEVVSAAEMRDHLYGGMDEPELGTIHILVSHVRKTIRAATGHNLIGVAWGKGYRFVAPLHLQ